MNKAQIISDHFPQLSDAQRSQFEALEALYQDWNAKINVISRKDMDAFYLHHVLHSLGIAKAVWFPAGATVLDVGTGGGFPGIPLAILRPDCHFTLEDSIGKKVRVAQAVASAIGLQNVETVHRNVIEEKRRFQFVVSRAVTALPALAGLVRKNVLPAKAPRQGGLLCLKGGDLTAETEAFAGRVTVWQLADFFSDPFFETKKVVHLAF